MEDTDYIRYFGCFFYNILARSNAHRPGSGGGSSTTVGFVLYPRWMVLKIPTIDFLLAYLFP